VRVLEPISTAGMSLRDVPELRERTRSRIIAELADMGRTGPTGATGQNR